MKAAACWAIIVAFAPVALFFLVVALLTDSAVRLFQEE